MSHTLPPHQFIDNPTSWQRCLDALRQVDQFAIDLESNGLFAYREQICLIQISTRTEDFIIDPLADLDWAPFGAIIEDPAIEKVLHASEYDLILMNRQHGWEMKNLFDTMWAARILGYEKIGLASMLGELYGMEISKKFQRANWCERPLPAENLAYAQTDTHFLLRMRDDLYADLEKKGHTEEVAEIFVEQARVKLPDTDFNPESFWSINGVFDLDHKNRAILRELNIMRDKEAFKRNRPPFKVFSNRTLLEVAELAPRSMRDLEPIRGMTHGQIRRYGKQMLSAVERGLAAPIPRQAARKRTPEDVLNRYDKLHLWRKEHARSRGVASDVVLYRDMMWELAHKNPQTMVELEAMEQMGPWRKKVYGEAILAVLLAI